MSVSLPWGDWFRLRVAKAVGLDLASTVTCAVDDRGRGIWAGKESRL
jgi:hypothetical protein